MPERVYGAKYDRNLTTVQIAARFRQDLKAEQKAGAIPRGLKFSVRSDYFSGGSSIHVSIKGFVAVGFQVPTREAAVAAVSKPCEFYRGEHRTPEAQALLKHVESMLGAYNHDGSDLMTDYFDVNFYSSVDYDHGEERAQQRALAGAPPEPPKPPPAPSHRSRREIRAAVAASPWPTENEPAAPAEAAPSRSVSLPTVLFPVGRVVGRA